jgi:hypothetical protein
VPWYVYGVVSSSAVLNRPPAGLDDQPVELVTSGDVVALASPLDDDAYAPGVVERETANVEWVGPRAMAHDRVLTWASDRAPVVPMPMWTAMFASRAGVEAMLREREGELTAVLVRVSRGREYALRMYRVDAELKTALPELSAAMRELGETAARASVGQRYLLERKMEEQAKTEVRNVAQRVASEVMDRLRPSALATATSPIPRTAAADAPGTMILNAAFLVAPDALRGFQEALTAIVDQYGTRGFRFDFTGPWPPYHFVEAGE